MTIPQLAGALLLAVAAAATLLSQRPVKPAAGIVLWLVYAASLVAGIALVTP